MTLLSAAENIDLEEIKRLLALEKGANINIQTKWGYTALMFVSYNQNDTILSNHVDCAKLLLDYGADVNIQSMHGCTALMYASKYTNKLSGVKCIKLLLEYG